MFDFRAVNHAFEKKLIQILNYGAFGNEYYKTITKMKMYSRNVSFFSDQRARNILVMLYFS